MFNQALFSQEALHTMVAIFRATDLGVGILSKIKINKPIISRRNPIKTYVFSRKKTPITKSAIPCSLLRDSKFVILGLVQMLAPTMMRMLPDTAMALSAKRVAPIKKKRTPNPITVNPVSLRSIWVC